jgi:hypothetical protein
MPELVVRNVLHVEGGNISLSQSQLLHQGLRIAPVNGDGIKIYDQAPAESTGQGRGNLVSVACQVGGLFRLDMKWLDMKVAGKRYRGRG